MPKAKEYFEQAIEGGNGQILAFNFLGAALPESLRSHPRYRAPLRKMDLEP